MGPNPGKWTRGAGPPGRGKWCYLYRAITAGGQTLDFYLSPKRNVAAAKRFLAKTLRPNASAGYPRVISTDKAPALAKGDY